MVFFSCHVMHVHLFPTKYGGKKANHSLKEAAYDKFLEVRKISKKNFQSPKLQHQDWSLGEDLVPRYPS